MKKKIVFLILIGLFSCQEDLDKTANQAENRQSSELMVEETLFQRVFIHELDPTFSISDLGASDKIFDIIKKLKSVMADTMGYSSFDKVPHFKFMNDTSSLFNKDTNYIYFLYRNEKQTVLRCDVVKENERIGTVHFLTNESSGSEIQFFQSLNQDDYENKILIKNKNQEVLLINFELGSWYPAWSKIRQISSVKLNEFKINRLDIINGAAHTRISKSFSGDWNLKKYQTTDLMNETNTKISTDITVNALIQFINNTNWSNKVSDHEITFKDHCIPFW